ncbi:MAG: uroporphyrinogen-III C-methyltransferase [Candidatus Puniceispirillaceae bacterium]|jgi:uroporphyrin-III C-methyltransferase
MSGTENNPTRRDQGTLPRLDARDWPEFQPGWVWMTGGGPGDPGLITLHALNALQQADVIVYDALVDPALLQWARADAQVEYAGKRGGKPSPSQRDISLRLIELARQGLRVLRLKGGDPFVFGRGGEEAQTLVKAGVRLRVIPGISAGIGGLAYAGIPVTHRDVNQSVTFLSGHDRTGLMPSAIDWQGLGSSAQVIVMYMAIKHMPDICAHLIAAGRAPDEPVAIVQNATRDDMKVLETTLAKAPQDITDSGIGAPSIVCVGRVVLMRQCLDWLGQMAGEPVRDEDPLGVRTMSDTA